MLFFFMAGVETAFSIELPIGVENNQPLSTENNFLAGLAYVLDRSVLGPNRRHNHFVLRLKNGNLYIGHPGEELQEKRKNKIKEILLGFVNKNEESKQEQKYILRLQKWICNNFSSTAFNKKKTMFSLHSEICEAITKKKIIFLSATHEDDITEKVSAQEKDFLENNLNIFLEYLYETRGHQKGRKEKLTRMACEKDNNENVHIRRLDAMARLLCAGNTDNCVALCFCQGVLYLATNDTEISEADQQKMIDIMQQWISYPKGDITMPSADSLENVTYVQRIRASYAKVIAAFRTGHATAFRYNQGLGKKKTKKNQNEQENQSIVALLEKKEVDLYRFPKSFKKTIADGRIVFVSGQKGEHAEEKIMNHLVDKEEELSIGISKLCCPLCYHSVCTNPYQTYYVRGAHQNMVPNWTLLGDSKRFEEFFGEEEVGQFFFNYYAQEMDMDPTYRSINLKDMLGKGFRSRASAGFQSESDVGLECSALRNELQEKYPVKVKNRAAA